MAEPFQVVLEDGVGDADRNAGAVAGLGVGVDGAAMGEADDTLDGLLDQLVRGNPVQPSDEASTAGVADVLGIVEPGYSVWLA